MIAEYGRLSAGYFDLVITDECHRSIYGKWSGALRHFDGIQLGLTATPCTARPQVDWGVDAAGAADPEDGHFVRDTLRFFEVERPTFRYELQRAIAEGYLAPYRIYRAMTVKTAAEGGFEVRRGELDWTAMDDAARAEFEELFGASEVIAVDPRALERKFTIPERNRAIVREFRGVLDNGFTGRDGIRRYPSRGKTIVFAVTKRHAETLATMFDEHFADLKPRPTTRYADFVVSDRGRRAVSGREHDHQALQGGGVSADPGQREHAGHRLRLPGDRQPGDGAVHEERRPLPADARARHPQGAAHPQDRLHDVRLRGGDGLPRRRRRGDCRRCREGTGGTGDTRPAAHAADPGRGRSHRPREPRLGDPRRERADRTDGGT